MWHQWFNCNLTKQREYLLCTKKTKTTTLFNNFFSSVSVDTRSRQYHDACIPLLANKPQRITFLHQNVDSYITSTTRMHTLVNTRRRLTEKQRNCWIKRLFFILCKQKYSRSFIKFCCGLCRVRNLSDFIKNILICVLKIKKVLRVWNDMRASN